MRQSGQAGQSKWAIALIVSILVHGLALFGLSRVYTARMARAAEAPVSIDVVGLEEPDDGGSELAIGPPQFSPPPSPDVPQSKNSSASADAPPPLSAQGTMRNPFSDYLGPGPASAGVAAAPGAGHGKGGFFGVPARGRRIAFVIDGSGSMGKNGAWSAARGELERSLQTLPEDVRFQVIVYHDVARPLLASKPGWLEPTPAIVREAIQALWQMPAEGATNHAAGLHAGLLLQPDDLYFLTDADDLTHEHLKLAVTLNPLNRTAIHTIELCLDHRDRPAMPMQVLARLTRGQYQAVDLARHR